MTTSTAGPAASHQVAYQRMLAALEQAEHAAETYAELVGEDTETRPPTRSWRAPGMSLAQRVEYELSKVAPATTTYVSPVGTRTDCVPPPGASVLTQLRLVVCSAPSRRGPCQRPFITAKWNQRYCSGACRQRAAYWRLKT